MAAQMLTEAGAGVLAGVYAEIRQRLGLAMVPNVFSAMAAVSADVLVQNWVVFKRTVLEGDLPRTLKEMIGLVVARESGCRYSLALFTEGLARLRVPEQVVRHLAESGDSEELPAAARSVLRFALAYSRDPESTDAAPLEAAGLTEDEVQEVIDTVLVAAGINQFAAESGLPVDTF
ncbi:MAG TPA: hypothetical protein VGK74_09070 [Symbiobacteriaceae bacterium]|jgi:AhpD family alkylhydroperoxidase